MSEINKERHPMLLSAKDSALVIIDIQSVLVPYIWESDKLIKNTGYIIEIAAMHEIPVILTEHNPKGLGATDERLVRVLKESGIGYNPLYKDIFSCCGHQDFVDAVKSSDKRQIIVTGMESHICVNQTVLDLINFGYQVHVVEDGVRARSENSHKIALEKMKLAGAVICDWEMAAYELTWGSKTDRFKSLLNLMKRAASELSESKM